MQTDGERIWVTRVLESERFPVEGRFLRSLVAFGWIPLLLAAGVVLISGDRATPNFLLAQGFATLLAVICPYLIHYYDDRVKPRFYDRAHHVVADQQELADLAAWADRTFARRYWVVTLLWTALIVVLYVTSTGFLRAIGIAGPSDPTFWLYGAFFVWGGLLTGIGFHGILTTVLYIRAVAERVAFRIDPLDPDGLGGLSAVGYFAIWTTLLASVGSLLFPLAFEIAAHGGFEPLVYVAIAVYVLFMLVAFVYPTLKINRRAQDLRETILDDLRADIAALQSELAIHDDNDGTPDLDELARQLEIQRLRNEYEEYRNVRLYPMSVDVLSRLVGSILLPLGFMGLELFLPRILG